MRKKKITIFFVIILSVVLYIATVHFCFAEDKVIIDSTNLFGAGNVIEGALLKMLAGVSFLIVIVCGWLLNTIIGAIISVASYDQFVNNSDIIMGWAVVRDLCNMFFILIFLVIAFATILRIESYQLKKLLPKLIIVAVLINFSKTICGLMIDFSQIIMLTFVSAFGDNGGNFIATLKVKEFLSAATNMEGKWFAEEDLNSTNTIVAMFIAIIFMVISVIVLLAILITFLMRMIMFWIYIVLSPLAFLLSAFPQGAKYASQYWGEFVKYLINGPVLAFFVWLALVTVSNFDTFGLAKVMNTCTTEIMCLPNFTGFMIAIGFMVGGLVVSQQIGGIGSSWGAGVAKNLGSKGLDLGRKAALAPLAGSWLGLKTGAGYVNSLLQETGRGDLNLKRVWEGWREQRKENEQTRYNTGLQNAKLIQEETGGTLATLASTLANPRRGWETYMDKKGRSQLWMGGAKLKAEREKLEPDLDYAKFQVQYLSSDENKKKEMMNDIQSREVEVDKKIQNEHDTKKLEELKKEKEDLSKKYTYGVRVNSMSDEMANKEKAKRKDEVKAKQKEYNKYLPEYDFETKSLEEKAVAEEAAKIGKIDDAQQLLAILGAELEKGKSADRSRIKALLMKLTKDGNDNEATLSLAGDSGYKGLQRLMDGLATPGSKSMNGSNLYAGFSQQEAYTLGAQLAEMNKKTNHWEATAGFVMDGGRWRKATDKEHVKITTTESGKRGARASMADNRLAVGSHVMDPETGEVKYVLQPTGVFQLKTYDNERMISRMNENMTESFAKFLAPFLDDLAGHGTISKELSNAIKLKAGEAVNFDKQYSDYTKAAKSAASNTQSIEDIIKEAKVLKDMDIEKLKRGGKTSGKA